MITYKYKLLPGHPKFYSFLCAEVQPPIDKERGRIESEDVSSAKGRVRKIKNAEIMLNVKRKGVHMYSCDFFSDICCVTLHFPGGKDRNLKSRGARLRLVTGGLTKSKRCLDLQVTQGQHFSSWKLYHLRLFYICKAGNCHGQNIFLSQFGRSQQHYSRGVSGHGNFEIFFLPVGKQHE